jgi:hypothetical protein
VLEPEKSFEHAKYLAKREETTGKTSHSSTMHLVSGIDNPQSLIGLGFHKHYEVVWYQYVDVSSQK